MKKIEEASHEYFRASQLGFENPGSEAGFKAGAEFAQRWISVEDELPESTDIKYEIICEYDNGSHDIYIIYDGASESSIEKMLSIHNITKWRPIEYK